jgi:lactoylglutathione lyase
MSDDPVVNHIGLATADLARSRRFYVELLGFVPERDLTVPDEASGPLLGVEPPVNLTASYLRRGAFVLELLWFDRPGNPPPRERPFTEPGLTHLSLSVDDLAGVVEQVPAFGGEVVFSSPMAAMVRDPDGQLVELLPMSYRQTVG